MLHLSGAISLPPTVYSNISQQIATPSFPLRIKLLMSSVKHRHDVISSTEERLRTNYHQVISCVLNQSRYMITWYESTKLEFDTKLVMKSMHSYYYRVMKVAIFINIDYISMYVRHYCVQDTSVFVNKIPQCERQLISANRPKWRFWWK